MAATKMTSAFIDCYSFAKMAYKLVNDVSSLDE